MTTQSQINKIVKRFAITKREGVILELNLELLVLLAERDQMVKDRERLISSKKK